MGAESAATDAVRSVHPVLQDGERVRCEVWTRVMGYHRSVDAFNRGKRQEHADRLHFSERPMGRGLCARAAMEH